MYLAPASRLRRICPLKLRRFIAAAGLFFAFILFLSRVLPLAAIYFPLVEIVEHFSERSLALYRKDPLKIIRIAMPVLGWSSFEGDDSTLNVMQLLKGAVRTVTGMDLRGPAALLSSQMPLLADVEPPGAIILEDPDYQTFENSTAQPASNLPGDALVSIYNTHTGETYGLTDGTDRLDGRLGGVVTVAAALQEALESKYGIKVARSDRINDAKYNDSYIESKKTAQELLAANPETRVLLDIHRDSGKTREQSVVKINGREAAPILLVVGSDTRRPFPDWRRNYAFAVELSNKINEMYPGLSLGVRVKDGVYNQSLHPRAVLVEVGTTKNSTEEAVRSARMLVDALAPLIMEKVEFGTTDTQEEE